MKLWRKVLAAALVLSLAFGGTAAYAKDHGKTDRKAAEKAGAKQEVKQTREKGADLDLLGGGIRIIVNGRTIILTLEDVQRESAWALRYIAKLIRQGVFTGYEDGTFRPNQKVTRIEAITAAVRLMGLRAQAESAEKTATKLNFKDADKIKKNYPWAVGYVAVAVENDLFLENEFEVQPDKPADRLWATILLVKALGLEKEAKAKMNTELPFKDKKQIPAGAVGYVAVAVERGIITGYEDNTFRPDRPVTRAELAAILDRSGEQLPGEETGNGQFRGVFAGLPNTGKIAVTVNGQTKQYDLAGDVTVLRGNAWATLADLKIGDRILFVVAGGKVVYINVTDPAAIADGQYAGTVAAVEGRSLTVAKDGKTTTFEVAENATVFRKDALASLKDIAVGDAVTVVVVGGKAVHVTVTAPAAENGEVSGVVTAVYAASLDVAANGVTVKYTLDNSAVIVRNGEVVGLSAVQPGDEVKLLLAGGKVVLLTVTKPVSENNNPVYEVSGTYQGHRTKDGKVTEISLSTTHNGTVVTRVYNVAPDAMVVGNALLLEEGVTPVKLLIVNQLVATITIVENK